MLKFKLAQPGETLRVLCLGAHSDDVEIGCGGTILSWIGQGIKVEAHWCVLSAVGLRAAEARGSATDFLEGAASAQISLGEFRDGYFPTESRELKNWFEFIKKTISPDVVFTHRGDDAHQDHREVAKLTWNTFRDHFILEYEIPKWDGDFGRPNFYQPVSAAVLERKTTLLLKHFGTQRSKDWFDADTFSGLARLRGMECRAPERFAEAFFLRKASLA